MKPEEYARRAVYSVNFQAGDDSQRIAIVANEIQHACADAIRRAVEEERERCAKIAERVEIMNTQKLPGLGEGRIFSIAQGKADVARHIAEAIREAPE